MNKTAPCPRCAHICRASYFNRASGEGTFSCRICQGSFSYSFKVAALLEQLRQKDNIIAELRKGEQN